MKADRLQAITDGVIAIDATIMVLELAIPQNDSLSELIAQWPILLAHFNSFFTIYILWYNHNKEFSKIDIVRPSIFLVNGVWLMIISILPFATAWVGNHSTSTAPQLFYSIILLLCTVLFQIIFYMIQKDYKENIKAYHQASKNLIPIYIGLVLAIISSFFMPSLSLIFVLIVIVIRTVQILIEKPQLRH